MTPVGGAPCIDIEAVGVKLGGTRIIDGISTVFRRGQINVLVGPNGSGKSTLRAAVVGTHAHFGSITIDGRPLADYPRRQRVEKVSLVAQNERVDTDLSVKQIVELGVLLRHGAFGSLTAADTAEVERAIEHSALSALKDRPWNSLSGGEQQRTQLARALAQQAQCVILDEPTNHLDIHHRIRLMEQLQHQAYHHGACVVIALHELDLAARFADHLVVMRAGHIVAQGPPAQALTESTLAEVFGIRARLKRCGKAVSLVVDEAVSDWHRR